MHRHAIKKQLVKNRGHNLKAYRKKIYVRDQEERGRKILAIISKVKNMAMLTIK